MVPWWYLIPAVVVGMILGLFTRNVAEMAQDKLE